MLDRVEAVSSSMAQLQPPEMQNIEATNIVINGDCGTGLLRTEIVSQRQHFRLSENSLATSSKSSQSSSVTLVPRSCMRLSEDLWITAQIRQKKLSRFGVPCFHPQAMAVDLALLHGPEDTTAGPEDIVPEQLELPGPR